MQNLTLTGWLPFRCMCLWYKKQSKYSVQIFFLCNSTQIYLLTLHSPVPKDTVPKTKSNLLQSPPIYTDSVASCNKSFLFIYVHSEYLQTTEIHNKIPQTSPSSHSLTNNLKCTGVLSLAGPLGVLTNRLI